MTVSEAAQFQGRGVRDLVDRLVRPSRKDRLTHLEVLPPRAPTYADWPGWVRPDVRAALEGRGVDRLWQHQAIAADDPVI